MAIRRKFSSQKKAEIVLTVLQGKKTVLEASKDYEILPTLIHKWKDQFLTQAHTIFETNEGDQARDEKIKKYEKVITTMATQNDFLEKVLAHYK